MRTGSSMEMPSGTEMSISSSGVSAITAGSGRASSFTTSMFRLLSVSRMRSNCSESSSISPSNSTISLYVRTPLLLPVSISSRTRAAIASALALFIIRGHSFRPVNCAALSRAWSAAHTVLSFVGDRRCSFPREFVRFGPGGAFPANWTGTAWPYPGPRRDRRAIPRN